MPKKQFYFVAALLLAIASCKNPDSIIGLNVQPPSDKLGLSIDTITLQTLTVREDTLRADKVLNLLGSDYNQVFGKTNVSFYSQVVFGGSVPTLGLSTDTLYSDSLVLRLAYNGYYGDTTQMLTVHVYRLAEDMNADSAYYNDKTFATDSELAVLHFYPLPNTSLTEYGVSIPPQLRIPLPKWLADTILSLNLQAGLASNANWISIFKGIYLKVDPVTTVGQGCIIPLNMSSLDSRMTLYFHRNTQGDDSLHYDFLFSGARSNHQEHDYTGTAVANQLMDSSVGNSINYIQGAAGVKVKIKMPYISNWASKGNIAVNRAELIINRTVSTDTLPPPTGLWVQLIDSTGAETYIPDQFESASYFGGAYNSTTRQYTFNITHYFQDIIKGTKTDHGLYVGVSGAAVLEYFGVIQANHVTIGSGNASADPATKMKLKIYYTKLN